MYTTSTVSKQKKRNARGEIPALILSYFAAEPVEAFIAG
jgi:hypothetical protein